MSFMEIYDILYYLLVLKVKMHFFEIELLDLVYWFLIEEAVLEDFVVQRNHILITK